MQYNCKVTLQNKIEGIELLKLKNILYSRNHLNLYLRIDSNLI